MAGITFRKGTVGSEAGLIADQRVYETRDGRIVGEGDPDAASLVSGPGVIIDPRTVARLRLSEKGQAEAVGGGQGSVVSSPSTVPEEKPAEVVRPLSLSGNPEETPEGEKPAKKGK